MQFPYRKEKMSYNNFQESRLRFSDSFNGQRWIFLRKGLDDFRDGFPPSSDNMIVYGKKHPVSIIVKNSTGNSSYTAPGKKIKKCTKTQIYLSKLSPLQQARRDYVAQIEHCLKRHPTVLYPRLEKSSSPKLFEEVAGVPGPEILFKSKAGYNDYQRETQTPQEVQDHMEDKQMKVTGCKKLVHSKEPLGKKACTLLSKVTEGGKKATQSHLAPLHEHTKRVTKHFCDWVMSLGGGNCSIDEDALQSLLHPSSESKEAGLLTPFCAAKLNDGQAEQSGKQEISPLKFAVRSSLHLGFLPCQVKVLYQPKREKIRYGAWYLDPKTWRKEIVNKPLEASEETINRIRNAKHHLSEKEMEVPQLHSTQAFKEFLERKGYQKPRFLLKMLAGGNDSGAQEKTSNSSKKWCPERNNKIRGSSSTTVNTD
ncbi:protein FAM47E isoform X1 [Anas platyrhynchos]|uniref:protein FAM47E isoform X1 n=2 Tax=Anas platyrhynchos TaxID=8839 RepID=UPI003AF229F1